MPVNITAHRTPGGHFGEKPRNLSKCSYCDMTFKKLEHAQRHERTHTRQRPYQCSACPKAFARQDTLNRHFRLHTRKSSSISSPGKGNARGSRGKRRHQSSSGVPTEDSANIDSPASSASASSPSNSSPSSHFVPAQTPSTSVLPSFTPAASAPSGSDDNPWPNHPSDKRYYLAGRSAALSRSALGAHSDMFTEGSFKHNPDQHHASPAASFAPLSPDGIELMRLIHNTPRNSGSVASYSMPAISLPHASHSQPRREMHYTHELMDDFNAGIENTHRPHEMSFDTASFSKNHSDDDSSVGTTISSKTSTGKVYEMQRNSTDAYVPDQGSPRVVRPESSTSDQFYDFLPCNGAPEKVDHHTDDPNSLFLFNGYLSPPDSMTQSNDPKTRSFNIALPSDGNDVLTSQEATPLFAQDTFHHSQAPISSMFNEGTNALCPSDNSLMNRSAYDGFFHLPSHDHDFTQSFHASHPSKPENALGIAFHDINDGLCSKTNFDF